MENLSSEVHALADAFRRNAKSEENFFWQTLQSDINGKTSWGEHISLYHGVAGIAFFLYEYGRAFNNAAAKDLAMQSLLSVIKSDDNEKPKSFALYTGILGAYVCLAKIECTEKIAVDPHLYNSLKTQIKSYIENPVPVDDFINGNSGTILGLLQLAYYKKDDDYLSFAHRLTEHLISRAYLSKSGLYWDRSQHTVSGLCGLSHGT
ncbi:MAG: lanthionine synthetase LanC family protein, partial [Luteibaculum sp.]